MMDVKNLFCGGSRAGSIPGGGNVQGAGSVQGGGSTGRSAKPARRIAALLLAAVTALTASFPAYAVVSSPQEPADVGKTAAQLNGYTEERWAQLTDNQLDYDEISDVIHEFNPTITSAWAILNENTRLMYTISDELTARKRDMEQLRDSAKTSGDLASYGNYYMQAAILEAASHNIYISADKMDREKTSTNRPLREAELQLSAGAKQLFIAYNSLRKQRDILSDSADMYEKLLSDARQRLSVGTATEKDVLSAQTSLLQAQSQMQTIDQNLGSIRKNLILLCGWKEDGNPVISETPAADPSRIDSMNPDTDLTEAVAHNGTIIDFRHEDHTKNSASWAVRSGSEEQMRQNLLVNLRNLKSEAEGDRAAYEAAQSGMSAAEITKKAADMQYELGMLSVANYLGAVTQYEAARTTLLTADANLFQAEENYDWAVAGTASVE